MRALFFVFLTLNIAYAGWNMLYAPQAAGLRETVTEKLGIIRPQSQAQKNFKQTSAGRAPSAQQQADADSNDSASTCWMLGPFDDDNTAKTLQQRLSTLQVTAQLRTLETPAASDYWVYIEPLMSRKAALEQLRELQASQIDSFIIGEGELENGISLGFFPDEKSASKVRRLREEDGYSVQMKSVLRSVEELWVVMRAHQYNKVETSQWQQLQHELGEWNERQNYCELIASTE